MGELLFWLVGAHFIGDFALQSSWMAENKSKLWFVMFAHVFIWSTIIAIPVKYFGYDLTPHIPVMFAVHYGIDYIKMFYFDQLENKTGSKARWYFYIDQFAHLIQILTLWVVLIGSK